MFLDHSGFKCYIFIKFKANRPEIFTKIHSFPQGCVDFHNALINLKKFEKNIFKFDTQNESSLCQQQL